MVRCGARLRDRPTNPHVAHILSFATVRQTLVFSHLLVSQKSIA
jgi:hypothetical protein